MLNAGAMKKTLLAHRNKVHIRPTAEEMKDFKNDNGDDDNEDDEDD